MPQRRQLASQLIVLLAVAVAGCGGGDSTVSSESLSPSLLPGSSLPGFRVERTLDWSSPVNLVGEGLSLPQTTHPTAAVKELDREHLEGAAGEVLKRGAGLDATEVNLGVARFKSDGDATAMRDWLHKQDLQQPCFSECAFSSKATPVPGVPDAKYVIQTASGKRKPPANYLAEFTIGPYLHWVTLHGDAGAGSQFAAGVKLYYDHAKKADAKTQ